MDSGLTCKVNAATHQRQIIRHADVFLRQPHPELVTQTPCKEPRQQITDCFGRFLHLGLASVNETLMTGLFEQPEQVFHHRRGALIRHSFFLHESGVEFGINLHADPSRLNHADMLPRSQDAPIQALKVQRRLRQPMRLLPSHGGVQHRLTCVVAPAHAHTLMLAEAEKLGSHDSARLAFNPAQQSISGSSSVNQRQRFR